MISKKNLNTFKVVSNAFYVVPFILACYWGFWVTAGLTAAVAGFGVLYHLSGEKRFLLSDTVSAYLLISSNFVLCYLGGFKAPYFYVALLFAFLAFTYHYYLQRKGEYSLNHGMWHLYGALITMFCIFTVVF